MNLLLFIQFQKRFKQPAINVWLPLDLRDKAELNDVITFHHYENSFFPVIDRFKHKENSSIEVAFLISLVSLT